MPPETQDDSLLTSWELIRNAHDAARSPTERTRARQELLERYEVFVRRVLKGMLKGVPDREAAVDEVVSLLGERVMKGRLHKADENRGRFRPFLRQVLNNLVKDRWEGCRTNELRLDQAPEPSVSGSVEINEKQFDDEYRVELLSRAMEALRQFEAQNNRPVRTALDLFTSGLRYAEIAERLSRDGPAVSVAVVGRLLMEARERLCRFFRGGVRQNLSAEQASEGEIDEELAGLGLLVFCQGRGGGAAPKE
jgi:DNA-directed RNA polymerase specialized sigma24 family protein